VDYDKHTSVHFDREKMCFVGIGTELLVKLRDTYKDVDVESELKKMELWLLSPKGNKRKGQLNFITNWLGNATPSQKAPEIEEDSELAPYLREYRRDLWKGREHILLMNKRKS
jgi:hypothetical protein